MQGAGPVFHHDATVSKVQGVNKMGQQQRHLRPVHGTGGLEDCLSRNRFGSLDVYAAAGFTAMEPAAHTSGARADPVESWPSTAVGSFSFCDLMRMDATLYGAPNPGFHALGRGPTHDWLVVA